MIPRLIIAGAGSGKTTDMVEEIMSALPSLNRNRVLATITYTNSAADTIKERLAQKIYIPQNVFIGTIHKFLNQFIVIPFASLFGQAGLDKLFLDIDVEKMAEQNIKVSKAAPNYFAIKNSVRSKITEALVMDGKIPLNQISGIAVQLLENKEIRATVCNRLQYLFIDEFQDVDTTQYQIFEHIRKGNRTLIYAVGDPEQYIMGFTYRGKKRPSFADLPINRFPAERIPKKENYRSHKPIVDFVNHFHTEIQQESKRGDNPVSKVVFIESLDLNEIVRAYQALCSGTSYEKPPLHFYLSFENKTFEQAMQFGLTPLVAERTSFKTTLETALEIICGIVGLTKKQISERYKLESLQIRKMGIDLLKKIAEGKIVDKPSLMNFIAGELRLEPNLIDSSIGDDLLHSLRLIMRGGKNLSTNHQFSSIHKAKGLEADTVLVLAKTNKELTNWLILNKDERISNKDDSCRIGYVAFTRAKILLCISCLEKVSDENRKTLEGLSVSFIKSISEPKQATLP